MGNAKVTHLSPLLFGDEGMWGGGERYPLELARAMSRRIPTRLVSFGERSSRKRDGNFEIEVLPLRGRWRGGDMNPLSERLPFVLGRRGIVHAHHYKSIVTNLAIVQGRALGNPVFCTDHGGSARHYAYELRLHKLLSAFLPVSRYSEGLFPLLADKASVVYGGVDIETFHPAEGEPEREVLFVGRLLPVKGVEVLVRALDAQTLLRVVGSEPDPIYSDRVKRLACGKRVVFSPPVPGRALADVYRRARVLVLPSLWSELFPLVVLEAMACGTPVVCTATGGMPEMVVDGETGFLVPPGDPDALWECVSRLLDDRSLRLRISAAALERVRAEFTWDHVVDRCLHAYGDAV